MHMEQRGLDILPALLRLPAILQRRTLIPCAQWSDAPVRKVLRAWHCEVLSAVELQEGRNMRYTSPYATWSIPSTPASKLRTIRVPLLVPVASARFQIQS